MAIKSLRSLRDSFWETFPEYARETGKTQNDYPIDVRMAWCDYVDCMYKDGEISDKLAHDATL